MPTYQYACTDCSEQLEVHQSFTDDALTDCPACDGRLRKVFNAVGVVFKGSGFYKTDSRAGQTGEKSDSAGKDSGKESGTTSKDSGSTGGKESGGSSSTSGTKDFGSSAKTSAA